MQLEIVFDNSLSMRVELAAISVVRVYASETEPEIVAQVEV